MIIEPVYMGIDCGTADGDKTAIAAVIRGEYKVLVVGAGGATCSINRSVVDSLVFGHGFAMFAFEELDPPVPRDLCIAKYLDPMDVMRGAIKLLGAMPIRYPRPQNTKPPPAPALKRRRRNDRMMRCNYDR